MSKNCSKHVNQNVMLSSQKMKVQFALYLTKVKKGTNTIFITGEDGIELDYLIPYGSRIIVKDGDVVSLGARFDRRFY